MAMFARVRSIFHWVRCRPRRTFGLAVISSFGLLNLFCFQHSWAMTHFVTGGKRTRRPESLTLADKAAVVLSGVRVPRPENGASPSDYGLAYSVETGRSEDGIDIETWYIPAASPSTRAVVVLCHGYASSKSALLSEARAFHEMGCGVSLIDFRGSGGSSGSVTTLGFSECADVAAGCQVAGRLAPGRPVVLYGRSMGSVAILRAIAVAGVRPAGIVLECPFDQLLETVRQRFSAMGLPSFPCAELMVFWGGVQHGMNGFAHNPVDYAARVACPSLFMHGDADKRVPLKNAEAVFGALTGEKTFRVFADLGHESCFRARPELWKQYVSEFLSALTDGEPEK
jgi:alpha-beta hydrolase superfamily lysophospholipase